MGKKTKKSCDFSRFEEGRRYFGKFLCTICKRHWQSNNAWLNYGQMCVHCKVFIKPYDMRPLRPNELILPNSCEASGDDYDPAKDVYPHPQELCERCIELGFSCWQTDLDPPTSLMSKPSDPSDQKIASLYAENTRSSSSSSSSSKAEVPASPSWKLLSNMTKCALVCVAIAFICKRYL